MYSGLNGHGVKYAMPQYVNYCISYWSAGLSSFFFIFNRASCQYTLDLDDSHAWDSANQMEFWVPCLSLTHFSLLGVK